MAAFSMTPEDMRVVSDDGRGTVGLVKMLPINNIRGELNRDGIMPSNPSLHLPSPSNYALLVGK